MTQHQVGILLAGRTAAQIDHHLLNGDNDAESLVIHYGHSFAVVQLLNAAQLTCEDAAGAVGVVDLVPNDILAVFLCFHLFTTADGQDRGVTAVCYGGPAQSRRSIYRRLLLGSGIL